MSVFLDSPAVDARTVLALTRLGLEELRARAPERTRSWIERAGFRAEAQSLCLLPEPGEGGAHALFGLGAEDDPWAVAALPGLLPPGDWRLEGCDDPTWTSIALALGAYRFERYRTQPKEQGVRFAWPDGADRARAGRLIAGVGRVRDLVNTPAADMGPAALSEQVRLVAQGHGARVHETIGDDLLTEGYPAVHAVGRASPRTPRLLDMTWGAADAPRVTLVGKGVCFDTGGLDLKTSSGMRLMKKDMGGAAHALALADMVMDAGLPVRLRVLIPAVDNAVSGDAMRPGDVLATRKGLTVEVGNTDAEGRLVLADALTEGAREAPALMIDFATLTGAARVALGPELPALFTPDDRLAEDLARLGRVHHDPVWRLPLHAPYRKLLDSKVADLCNISDGPFAGAVTAALFLREFAEGAQAWAHLDLYAWNNTSRPGRPEGGEAMGLRAAFALIEERFG